MIRGALAGAVAGLIASWAMESFRMAWNTTADQWRRQPVLLRGSAGRRGGAKGGLEDPGRRDLPETSATGGEPATMKEASASAEPVLERGLSDRENPVAGEIVHYGFGAIAGAFYGVLADLRLSPVRAFNGMVYGVALWAIIDEVTLQELALPRASTDFPGRTDMYRIASHLVYGFTLESVRRAIRWLA